MYCVKSCFCKQFIGCVFLKFFMFLISKNKFIYEIAAGDGCVLLQFAADGGVLLAAACSQIMCFLALFAAGGWLCPAVIAAICWQILWLAVIGPLLSAVSGGCGLILFVLNLDFSEQKLILCLLFLYYFFLLASTCLILFLFINDISLKSLLLEIK